MLILFLALCSGGLCFWSVIIQENRIRSEYQLQKALEMRKISAEASRLEQRLCVSAGQVLFDETEGAPAEILLDDGAIFPVAASFHFVQKKGKYSFVVTSEGALEKGEFKTLIEYAITKEGSLCRTFDSSLALSAELVKNYPSADIRENPKKTAFKFFSDLPLNFLPKHQFQGFVFRAFDGKYFLTSSAYAADGGYCIQGFLLDEVRTVEFFRINGESFLPVRAIQNSEKSTEDFQFCGIPMKISPLGYDFSETITASLFRISLGMVLVLFLMLIACVLAVYQSLKISRFESAMRLFSASIAHDLRHAISSAEATASKIFLRFGDNADVAKNQRNVKALSDFLEEILALSQFLNSKKTLSLQNAYRLGNFLPGIFERIEELLGRSGYDLEVYVSELAGKTELKTSPWAIERILANVASNAARHAEAEDRLFRVAVSVCDDVLVFRMSDAGKGISYSREKPLKGSDSFTRSLLAGEIPAKLGIGLQLAKVVADSIEADFFLERTSEPGTTFLLKIRIRK